MSAAVTIVNSLHGMPSPKRMPRMRPRAMLLRTVTPCSSSGKARSSTYRARPVTFPRPSFRRTECPKNFSSMSPGPFKEYAAQAGHPRFSVPDPVAFSRPFAKRLEPRFPHHRLERNPARAVRALQFFVDEGIVESGFRGIVRGGRKKNPVRPRPVDGAEAHRTGLAARVDLAAGQLKRAQSAAGFANGSHFRVRRGIVRGSDQICAGRDDASTLHYDRAEGAAPPRTHVLHRRLDRLLHEGVAHSAERAPRPHPANCTGKADPAVYSFVMCPIGFTDCDLRLDFRKFACKIIFWCGVRL